MRGDMDYRPYDPELDGEAVHRIYREIGWSDGSERGEETARLFSIQGRTLVALVRGEPVCSITTVLRSLTSTTSTT